MDNRRLAILDTIRKAGSRSSFDKPIPSELDRAVLQLVNAYQSAGTEARIAIESEIKDVHIRVIIPAIERLAALAVRTRNENIVRDALVGLSLGCLQTDTRDLLVRLSVLDDSCLRIGVSPAKVFEEVRQLVQKDFVGILDQWLKRKDRSIKSMGYSTDGDGAEFRYIRR